VRILVTGGRDYSNSERLFAALDKVHKIKGISLIIQGGARGADSLAKEWAFSRGVPVCQFDANWDFHGKKAGYIRNKDMLELGLPDAAVAFSGGRGTASMVKLLKDNNIGVWVVD